ncbi:MAG: lipid-A-disaccharide synthase [Deltaproteobacteria bacterium]|nr:lipid-A-disaccharide synthase [Deltaproteobacteria bacterium]
MQPKNLDIMIVAGEASGDLHGANLVRAMRDINSDLCFYGVGGERMKEAGVSLTAHSSEMAVMGITEVFPRLGFILKVRRELKKSLRQSRPALLILIDYPGFNLPLAKFARENGIKVFYYISPKVWAWRKKRIYALEKYVDRMALILPFEEQVYEEVNLDARFIGNPLLDTVKRKYTRGEALKKFGLKKNLTTIALLPGSRKSEVIRLLPEMLGMAKILKERIPAIQFVLPLADTISPDFVHGLTDRSGVDIRIIEGNVYDVVGLSDIAVVASGTATLETAILGVPMIIVYRVSPLTYLIGRAVVKVDNIGLVNIIAEKTVAPELIQGDANPEKMADEVYDILTGGSRMDEMKRDLLDVSKKLGDPGASKRAARLAYEMILE